MWIFLTISFLTQLGQIDLPSWPPSLLPYLSAILVFAVAPKWQRFDTESTQALPDWPWTPILPGLARSAWAPLPWRHLHPSALQPKSGTHPTLFGKFVRFVQLMSVFLSVWLRRRFRGSCVWRIWLRFEQFRAGLGWMSFGKLWPWILHLRFSSRYGLSNSFLFAVQSLSVRALPSQRHEILQLLIWQAHQLFLVFHLLMPSWAWQQHWNSCNGALKVLNVKCCVKHEHLMKYLNYL